MSEPPPGSPAPPPRPWWDARRPAGFRFSLTDAVVILVCAGATWGLRQPIGPLILVCPVALGHFFLFCNVFRVGRPSEIIWSVLFIVNCVVWVPFDVLGWLRLIAAQSPAALAVIALTITRRDYHGWGWSVVRRWRKLESRAKHDP